MSLGTEHSTNVGARSPVSMVADQLPSDSWRQVCHAYRFSSETRVKPLSVEANRTYQISSPGAPPQILRLSYRGAKATSVQAELSLLTYLNQATTLRVPGPIANHADQYLLSFGGAEPIGIDSGCSVFLCTG